MTIAATPNDNLFSSRIVGNIHFRSRPLHKRLHPVDVDWRECGERALRKKTRAGRNISIPLPLRAHLRHGDILLEDEATIVVVDVIPSNVLVCRPSTIEEMGQIAIELGNLHIPAQIVEDQIITPDEPEAKAAFICCGLYYEQIITRFEPARRLMPLVRLAADFRVIRNRAT